MINKKCLVLFSAIALGTITSCGSPSDNNNDDNNNNNEPPIE